MDKQSKENVEDVSPTRGGMECVN